VNMKYLFCRSFPQRAIRPQRSKLLPVCCPEIASACLPGQQKCPFAGTSRDGSDGTRTRDLRRDRPVRGSRRLPTIDAQSLYSCGFRGRLRGSIPHGCAKPISDVCCPFAARAGPPDQYDEPLRARRSAGPRPSEAGEGLRGRTSTAQAGGYPSAGSRGSRYCEIRCAAGGSRFASTAIT
jgi:hypothetical protein